MRKLHHLLDTQSTLVVHPLMGLYIALPCTTHIPLINGPWKTLLRQRDLFWTFLGDQVEVRSDQVIFSLLLIRIINVVLLRAVMKIISHFHILKRCEGGEKMESIWDHSGTDHYKHSSNSHHFPTLSHCITHYKIKNALIFIIIFILFS